MAQKYRYGLVNRPPWCMLVPDHPHELEAPLADEEGHPYTRHGIIVFERPLPVEEICRYELALLADPELMNALAIEVALAASESAVDWVELSRENPRHFRTLIAEILREIRPYRVYVGELAQFSTLVIRWLVGLTTQSMATDADLLSVLHADELPRRQSANSASIR